MCKSNSLTITDENGESIVIPSKWAICSACSGHGKSSAYLGAYTQDEMAEQGSDFLEDYMSGFYDRTCEACEGSGKVLEADVARMTPEQVRIMEEEDQFEADYQAEREAERRMGC